MDLKTLQTRYAAPPNMPGGTTNETRAASGWRGPSGPGPHYKARDESSSLHPTRFNQAHDPLHTAWRRPGAGTRSAISNRRGFNRPLWEGWPDEGLHGPSPNTPVGPTPRVSRSRPRL